MRLLILGVLLCFPALLHARLGETIEQIEARYGPHAKGGGEGDSRSYLFKSYFIAVDFVDGVSAQEMVASKDGGKTPFPKEELEQLLAAYSDSKAWKVALSGDIKTDTWNREDGAAAAYNKAGPLYAFIVQSADYIAKSKGNAKQRAAEKASGL